MCCFSRPVDSVSLTRIFARAAEDQEQFLVYSMRLKTMTDVAMILPIPVPEKVEDDAVTFINLEEYKAFFVHLERGFPRPPAARGRATDSKRPAPESAPPLKVEDVGSYEASFVPTVRDFSRLDDRFRLPDGTWDKLPQYEEFGFVVFKFREGSQNVHPMAFRFPTALPERLFFPTVHIHDGEVHERAKFDHTLYCQFGDKQDPPARLWKESPSLAGDFVSIDRTEGIVDGDAHCYRLRMRGTHQNADVLA